MAQLPLTIAIPTFNSEPYIAECINSAIAQSFGDFEILIIDNDSTDNTLGIIRAVGDTRVRLIKNDKNMGPHYSFDLIHHEAKGKFVRTLCSDDVLLPDVVKDQMRLACKIPNIGLVTCDYFITDSNLKPTSYYQNIQSVASGADVAKHCFKRRRNLVGGPSNFLYPADKARRIMTRSDIRFLGDLDYALRLLDEGMYANTNMPGYYYRRHENTDTNRVLSAEQETSDWIKLLASHDAMNHENWIWLNRRKKFESDAEWLRKWGREHRNCKLYIQGLASAICSRLRKL